MHAQMIDEPNLDRIVLCRAKEDIGEVALDDDVALELIKGNMYLVRYRLIQSLLLGGQLELV